MLVQFISGFRVVVNSENKKLYFEEKFPFKKILLWHWNKLLDSWVSEWWFLFSILHLLPLIYPYPICKSVDPDSYSKYTDPDPQSCWIGTDPNWFRIHKWQHCSHSWTPNCSPGKKREFKCKLLFSIIRAPTFLIRSCRCLAFTTSSLIFFSFSWKW